jgi:hypothetical protein
LSVVMMLRVKGDPDALERYAQENGEQLQRIAEDGKSKGALHHVFAGGDGEIIVLDQWPDEASFQSFFDGQDEIPQVMQGAGAEGEPEVSFFRILDTPDKF